MFYWFVQVVWKLLKIVMICEITCLENHVQLLGEHVGLHIQVWMVVFWLGRIYCRQRCFCSLLSCYQSPVGLMSLWLRLCLKIWSSQKFRVWGSKLFLCIEGGANTEDRATTFIDSLQLHWIAWTLQINQSAVFYDLNQFLQKKELKAQETSLQNIFET